VAQTYMHEANLTQSIDLLQLTWFSKHIHLFNAFD